jgi:D-tyrosyl-tRNA(Tyr) deacylase
MRALLQRVSRASVWVGDDCLGQIQQGLLVYVGIAAEDTGEDARKLAGRVASLRVFEDGAGKMNLSVQQVGGGILAISNFTLQADTRKGRRPSFAPAMGAEQARELHRRFLEYLRTEASTVETGRFGAEMRIESCADGPVNVLLESRC